MSNEVLNGLDNQQAIREAVGSRRAGLVTNPSAIDRQAHAAVDVLPEICNITAFFGPEHGIRGDLQNGVSFTDGIDPKTGKKVFALYGKLSHLTAERLEDIDVIIYDIQDVGSRPFSYLRTLAFLMEDCIAFDRELIVLDRINPLGGECYEGPVSEAAFDKHWGYGVTMRFGLTVGEYARMVNKRYFENRCRLTVIPCMNWRRDMMFDDCGLFWVNPSPNLPNTPSALIYAGCAAFGQTSISEARGTTRPYEMYGAPFADGYKIADKLNAMDLPGVWFRPCAFTAEYNAMKKYIGECCRGVQLFITDRRKFKPFETGMWMLETFREHCPGFEIPFANGRCEDILFDCVLGSADWRTGKLTTAQFIERGRRESAEYKKSVQEFLIYR